MEKTRFVDWCHEQDTDPTFPKILCQQTKLLRNPKLCLKLPPLIFGPEKSFLRTFSCRSLLKRFVKNFVKMAHYSGPASESQRVMHLNKKREREQEEIEIKKRKLENDLKGTFIYYVSTFLWFLDPYLRVILGQWDILIWPPLVSRIFLDVPSLSFSFLQMLML